MSMDEHQQSEIIMLRVFDSQDDSMLEAIQNMSRENCEEVAFDYLQDCVSSLESKDSGIHLSPISADNSNIDLKLHGINRVPKATELTTIDLNFIKIENIFLENEHKNENKLMRENVQIAEPKNDSVHTNDDANMFTNLSKQTIDINYDKLNIVSAENNLANSKDNILLGFNEETFNLCSIIDKSTENVLSRLNDNCHVKQIEDNKTVCIESNVLCDSNDTNFNSNDINFTIKPLAPSSEEIKNKISYDNLKICEQCPMTFRYKRHLDRHLEGHQKNNCTNCNAKFARRKHLEVHLFRMHGERVVKHAYPCDICSSSFPKKILLDRHRVKHNIKDDQMIIENTDSVIKNENEQMHQNVKKEFTCPSCLQMFDNEQTYRNHIRTHENQKCPKCNSVFDCEKNMNEHVKSAHTIVSEETINTDNGFYFCTDCRHKFTRKEDYLCHLGTPQHLAKVNANMPIKSVFTCTICSKELISQRALDQHIRRIHKGEKRFSCDMYGCTFQCSTRSDLDRHRHLHIEERNVICEHCGKTFTSVSILNDHVLYVHNKERQFVCEECGKAFKRNSLLKRHKLSHQQLRPFACMQCSTAFKRSHHLTRHMESCHRITLEKKKKVMKLMKTETGSLIPIPEKPKKLRCKRSKIKKASDLMRGLNENLISSTTDSEMVSSTVIKTETQTQTLESSDDSFKTSTLSTELLNLLPSENNQQVLSLVDVTSGQIVTVEVTSPESSQVNDLVNQLEPNYNEMLSLSDYQDLEFNSGILNVEQNYYENANYVESSLENVESSFLLDSSSNKIDVIDNYLAQPFPPFLNL